MQLINFDDNNFISFHMWEYISFTAHTFHLQIAGVFQHSAATANTMHSFIYYYYSFDVDAK